MSLARQRVKPSLLLALACIAAAIPPLLVFLDRWYANQTVRTFLRGWWCESKARCDLLWPPYFLIVWTCCLVVIGLVAWIGAERADEFVAPSSVRASDEISSVQRRVGAMLIVAGLVGVVATVIRFFNAPGVPGLEYVLICLLFVGGWFVATTEPGRVWSAVERNWKLVLAYLLGLAGLLWLLFNYYSSNQLGVFSLILAAVGVLALYAVRKQVSPVYWLVLMAFVLYTLQLNAWNFSVVGDAGAFRGAAQDVATRKHWLQVAERVFDAKGVYGTHPYLSSILLAPPMVFFDVKNFGWRLGSIAPSVLSIFFFYYFFRAFLSRGLALFASFLIAVSHYLMTFSHIGYNNTQSLLAMGMAFAAATFAISSGKRWAYVVTGLAISFCFYNFPGSLYIIPIVLWYLFLYRQANWRENLLSWGILLLTVLVFITPLFFQPSYWTTKVLGTLFWNGDIAPTPLLLAQRILTQFGYVLFSWLYVGKETHFLRLAYVDGITAVLVLLGIGVLLRRIRTDKFALFALSGLFLFGLIGATGGTVAPPNTRMFLLVPWYALIAAVGLRWLGMRLADVSWKLPMGRPLAAVLLVLILGLNLYIAYDYGVRPPTGYLEFDSLFYRVAQNVNAQTATPPNAIVFAKNPERDNLPSLDGALRLGYLDVPLKGLDVTATDTKYPRSLVNRNNIVVISPQVPSDVRNSLAKFLSDNGKVVCNMLSESGDKRFQVWRADSIPDVCTPQQLWQPIHFPDPLATGLILVGLVAGLAGLYYRERHGQAATNVPTISPPSAALQLPLTTTVQVQRGANSEIILPSSANHVQGGDELPSRPTPTYGLEINLRISLFTPNGKRREKKQEE